MGIVPDGVLTIGINPDWRPSHLARAFADEGRLMSGTVLFTANDLSPWLERRRERREARWSAQHTKPVAPVPEEGHP